MDIQTIETERLYLRGFTKEDARFAISIWNDPEMGKYLRDPDLEEIDPAYLKEIEELGDDEECCYLISISKETGERIGTCSFIPDLLKETYDIAYCVHKDYWHNGYATEMVRGMVAYAQSQGAKKITVSVTQGNTASIALVQKLGFQLAGSGTYIKRGTTTEFSDFNYELTLP